jgi:class 3 adenylate cyclase
MSLAEDLEKEVGSIFRSAWNIRDGQQVPEPEDIQLGNYGVNLDATVLYADLAQSTAMVSNYSPEFAAEVYKAYLHCAAKVIKDQGGAITAYDGDRVMAVFIGGSKNTNAAITALKINFAVTKIINPKLVEQYPSAKGSFEVKQAVGIDTGKLLVARTGVRGANDLVWVGRAANYAAKLCDMRQGSYASFITSDVYNNLNESAKISQGQNMWESIFWPAYQINIYRSSWWWDVAQ